VVAQHVILTVLSELIKIPFRPKGSQVAALQPVDITLKIFNTISHSRWAQTSISYHKLASSHILNHIPFLKKVLIQYSEGRPLDIFIYDTVFTQKYVIFALP
jgi:hypothetical protein